MNQISQIISEVKKAVVGKDRVLIWVMTVILARGHILLEDIPGVGKTTMALAFSRALGLDYGRVQFTPDVLPSDITGYSIYNKDTGEMRYQPGAILCNLFLADELNRATSRTQSALLEAMEEGQVTVDGISHRIPQPFCVFATQNPTGASGTQLLPDSQMDRFTVRMSIGYPAPADERNMVLNRQGSNPLGQVRQVHEGRDRRLRRFAGRRDAKPSAHSARSQSARNALRHGNGEGRRVHSGPRLRCSQGRSSRFRQHRCAPPADDAGGRGEGYHA